MADWLNYDRPIRRFTPYPVNYGDRKLKLNINYLIVVLLLLALLGCTSVPQVNEPAPAPVLEIPPTQAEIVSDPTEIPAPTLASVSDATTVEPTPIVEDETEPAIVIVESEPAPTATVFLEPTPTLSPAETIINSFTGSSQTNGDILILYGEVVDPTGNPIPDAMVEIWQTDSTGVYDHPRDPGTGTRDTTFQFFGSAPVNENGWYAFRTILPGEYEPRPRHIHFKVKQNGNTLLTSQFYFSEDIAVVEDEGIFRSAGESGDLLLLQLTQGESEILSYGRIVLNSGSAGDLPITPSQAEGPYYPVVDLDQYDNDLVVLP